MIYALKVVEFIVLVVYLMALTGAYYQYKDRFGGKSAMTLESFIIGFLSVSALLHLINLFR